MMKGVAAALVLGVSMLGVSGWRQQPTRIHKFSELPRGNLLRIDVQTSGCFEQNANYFIFHSRPAPILEIAGLPTQTLSETDVKGLDKLLEFYRHVKNGSCTSTDTISLEEYSGDTLVAKETYVDSTCKTLDDNKMFSLRTLIDRARDLKKR